MKKIEKVLVASDLGENSKNLIERGLLLGKNVKTKVYHVVAQNLFSKLKATLGLESEQELVRLTNDKLKDFVSTLGTEKEIESEVLFGHIPEEIAAKAKDYDLLLLGASKSGLKKDLYLGTNAQVILHQAKKPVLTVRQKCEGSYKNILVAVDYTELSLRSLKICKELFPEANISVINVFEHPAKTMMIYAGVSLDAIKEYEDKAKVDSQLSMAQLLDEAGLEISEKNIFFKSGHPVMQILDTIKDFNFDLVVLGKHSKSFTENHLLGTTTLKTLNSVEIDSLVVR